MLFRSLLYSVFLFPHFIFIRVCVCVCVHRSSARILLEGLVEWVCEAVAASLLFVLFFGAVPLYLSLNLSTTPLLLFLFLLRGRFK